MALGIVWLAILFALSAALYASVGFGGGSTYIALLALADVDYRALPVIALLVQYYRGYRRNIAVCRARIDRLAADLADTDTVRSRGLDRRSHRH